RLRRLELGDAAQDASGRAAGGARARLPGVPRARGEGSPPADAGRHLRSMAPVGDRARRHRALDLQLPGPEGLEAVLVHEPRRFHAAELRARSRRLRAAYGRGDPHDAAGLRRCRRRPPRGPALSRARRAAGGAGAAAGPSERWAAAFLVHAVAWKPNARMRTRSSTPTAIRLRS